MTILRRGIELTEYVRRQRLKAYSLVLWDLKSGVDTKKRYNLILWTPREAYKVTKTTYYVYNIFSEKGFKRI